MLVTDNNLIDSKIEFNKKHYSASVFAHPNPKFHTLNYQKEMLYLAQELAKLLIENNINKSEFQEMTKDDILDLLHNNDTAEYDTTYIKDLIDIPSKDFQLCQERAAKYNNTETITYPINYFGKTYRNDKTFNYFRTLTIFELKLINPKK